MNVHSRKTNTNTHLLIIISVLLLTGLAFAGYYYRNFLAGNTKQTGKLYIPTGASYEQVLDSLKPYLKNIGSFEQVAKQKKYDKSIKPGRYTIKKGESNTHLINRLRIGSQDDISIRIGNYTSIMELAGKVAPYLETDSASLVEAMVMADFAKGIDTAKLIAFYFPNTYNFHWTTDGKAFATRMKKEYDKYWTAEKHQMATQKNMSPLDVITLASIVQLESAKVDEQPKVAALYLNRLRIGMKLDADPTVVYAMQKAAGFKLKINRVYYKNLSIESPYNTYKNKGLPPGPICMPNASAIDAVLQPEQHDYLFFVADPQKPGYHIFAKTLKEQEENAKAYRQWLNNNQVR